MATQRVTRRRVLIGAGAVGVVGSLAPIGAFADDQGKGELVRWDLVQIVHSVVLPGGIDTGLQVWQLCFRPLKTRSPHPLSASRRSSCPARPTPPVAALDDHPAVIKIGRPQV
jgi:hypothetical protein